MKEAIVLEVEGKNIVTRREYQKCFHEMSTALGYPMKVGFVPDTPELPDLDEVISCLNGTKNPKAFDFTSTAPTQEALPASMATPDVEKADAEENSDAQGDFAGLGDEARAELLRAWIKGRITQGDHDLPDCARNEVRVGKIFENWHTGLSRGSISRLAKRAIEEIEGSGYQIFRGAGRYYKQRDPQ